MDFRSSRTVRAKKNVIKDSYDAVHNALMHCKLQEKNATITIIVYLNNPFQDSTQHMTNFLIKDMARSFS
jgi:hypothetical protein